MRPRKLSEDQAANLVRIFLEERVRYRARLGERGINQYDISGLMIGMAFRCWRQHGDGGLNALEEMRDIERTFGRDYPYSCLLGSNSDELNVIASNWSICESDLKALSLFMIGQTPQSLVQQVKRWRKRLSNPYQVHNQHHE
jgi:hypothetical protein